MPFGSLARHQRRGDDGGDPLHRAGIVDGPLKGLEAAIGRADDRNQPVDAEMIEQQPLRADDVADIDVGKSRPVRLAGCGVDACGIGRSVGRAQHVRANRKIAVGIDRLARADQLVPAAFAGRAAGIDDLRAAGIAVRDQHGIAAIGRQRAERRIADRHLGHHDAALQAIVAGGEGLRVSREICAVMSSSLGR